jgi:hypothetical protein
MSETEDAFVRATDELIALYRNVERKTLDPPWLSLMPFVMAFPGSKTCGQPASVIAPNRQRKRNLS